MQSRAAALTLEQVLHLDPPTYSTVSSSEPVHDLWEHGRACLLSGRVEDRYGESLRRLAAVRHLLLISNLQAKLLLSLLSAPLEAPNAELLQSLRASALLLSCSWLRGVCSSSFGRKGPASSVPVSLQSVVDATSQSLQDRHLLAAYVCEAVLLLGLVCVTPGCPPEVGAQARQVILVQLSSLQGFPRQLEYLLAGLGYLMTASHGLDLSSVCTALLSLWSAEGLGLAPTLVDCLRLIHFFQFYCSSLDDSPHSVAMSDGLLVLRQFVRAAGGGSCSTAYRVAVMAATGFLRSLSRSNQPEWGPFAAESQNILALFAKHLLPLVAADGPWFTILSSTNVQPDCMRVIPAGGSVLVTFQPIDCLAPNVQHCLQCLALAVAHCGPLPFSPEVLFCLLSVLVGDLLNLSYLHSALMTEASVYVAGSPCLQQLNKQGQHKLGCSMEGRGRHGRPVARRGSCTECELQHLSTRTAGVLFQHTRAVARALCQQYQCCPSNMQSLTQATLWQHARAVYDARRFLYVSVHLVMPVVEPGLQVSIKALENIVHAASFLDVIFFSLVVDGLTAERNGIGACSSRELVAALALDSLSCMPLGRGSYKGQYGRLVASSIHIVAQSDQACTALARHIPCYTEILHCPGLVGSYGTSYHWDVDKIQAGRVYFYLGILPNCLKRLSHRLFEIYVAPVMFLYPAFSTLCTMHQPRYMQHPSQEMTKACHLLFKALLCDGNISGEENGQYADKNPIRKAKFANEQLVAFYCKISLETYPGITSFDNFVSVMGAIVQYLPPGNPAIVHCINMLVDKYEMLHETASKLELRLAGDKTVVLSDHFSHAEAAEVTKAAEAIQHLLLHLIPRVDSLVLPELLKVVAKLVLSLHVDGRCSILQEIFDIVVNIHDYTRKPILIPWLQSLAFLARSEYVPTPIHGNDVGKLLSTTSRKAKVSIHEWWLCLATRSHL